MKKALLILSLLSVCSLFYLSQHDFEYDPGRTPASVPRNIQELYQKFADNSYYDLESGYNDSYETFMRNFNDQKAPTLAADQDWIDSFIETLPDRAKRHYTFVHRSYSVQSGTPMAPRVILFTPDARTIMTFNSNLDENNEPIADVTGDQSIEVIEWNSDTISWDFAELKLKEGKVVANKNPDSCVMCHAGTPKPITVKNSSFYKGKLKPIFAQYPLWPGFYGSVNDIIGVPGTGDSIMANEQDTMKHIKEFLFDDSEELSGLRADVDNNPKYLDVVRNEMTIHHENFQPFIESMKNRPRYQHLITLASLYTQENQPVPEFLKSAPYRRTFNKKYGHYIFRPNFYLSTLMTFYQAQAIAKEIIEFPEYQRFKYSLLAAKFNCSGAYNLKSGSLSLTDLNPSFDLVYPNISSEETKNRQYLLAYQYNLVQEEQTQIPHLPLFAWNLEANENIASYHYGNVFSDLNELVLWHLVGEAFDDINIEDGRDAHEDRHAELDVKNHFNRNIDDIELFERSLKENISEVSRFSTSQWNFATKRSPYYGIKGTKKKFKGLPASKHCRSSFIPAAKKELRTLAESKVNNEPLPHEVYSLNNKLADIEHIPLSELFQPTALNGTRQGCEECHSNNLMLPQFNTDWHSNNYYETVQAPASAWFRDSKREHTPLKDKFLEVLDPEESLPVPFGNLMPYARKPMDPFSLFCEKKLIINAYASKAPLLNFDEKFNCKRIPKVLDGVPQFTPSGKPALTADTASEENILNCKCRSLYIRKSSLSREYFNL